MYTNVTGIKSPASTKSHPVCRGRLFATAAGAGLVLILAGCTTVPVNPGDISEPSVVIKLRGSDGQWDAQSTLDLNGSPIQAMAVVDDQQGVKRVSLQYVNGTAQHCTVSGAFYNGSFSLGAPGPVQQSLSGSSGKVPTTLPLIVTIPGSFTCTVPNVGEGTPIGYTLLLRATGTNWSSNASNASATTDLQIKL
jgi:hypothetical protein